MTDQERNGPWVTAVMSSMLLFAAALSVALGRPLVVTAALAVATSIAACFWLKDARGSSVEGET